MKVVESNEFRLGYINTHVQITVSQDKKAKVEEILGKIA
jgi:hypothetical protein